MVLFDQVLSSVLWTRRQSFAGITIEYSLTPDQEEGPAEPDPADDRVFIISKKGEHYLHVTPTGTSEADVARQLLVAQDSVRTAVDTTRRTVDQACAHAEEATTQLQIAASVEQAKDSVKQVASESVASAASSAVPAAKAEVKTEVSGSRQAEGESTSPDEKPFLHAFWLMTARTKSQSRQN